MVFAARIQNCHTKAISREDPLGRHQVEFQIFRLFGAQDRTSLQYLRHKSLERNFFRSTRYPTGSNIFYHFSKIILRTTKNVDVNSLQLGGSIRTWSLRHTKNGGEKSWNFERKNFPPFVKLLKIFSSIFLVFFNFYFHRLWCRRWLEIHFAHVLFRCSHDATLRNTKKDSKNGITTQPPKISSQCCTFSVLEMWVHVQGVGETSKLPPQFCISLLTFLPLRTPSPTVTICSYFSTIGH